MDKQKKLTSNVYKYYLFQFFNNLAFFSPVIVLFWQSNGLNMTKILLLQSIYSLGVIILELPTGVFADYFGKRKSLILGALFWTIGTFWYGLSHHFWQFVIGELTAGVGAAFISGADRAYIHQLLKSADQENDFKKIEGKARGIIQIAQAIGSLLGGFIASIYLGLTLIATSFSTFASFIVGLSFPKTNLELPREEKTNYIQMIKESIKLVKNQKRLLWLTLFFASFNGLIWPLIFYSQPYLKMLGVPMFLFGAIFMLFNLITALGSALTHRFENLTKDSSFLVISIVSVISLFLLGSFKSILVFPLWSLFLTFAFMNQTIISGQVLKIIPAEKAATVLSFQNLVRRFSYAIIGPILGMVSDSFGINKALVYYSLFIAIILGIILFQRKSSFA